MNKQTESARALLDQMMAFAILVVILVVVLVVALIVRLARQSQKWRRFRTLLQEWLEEREKHESQ